MTAFDIFVLAITASSAVAGAFRGLVRALVAGAALLVGLLTAAHWYEPAGVLLRGLGLVESNAAASAGGFLLIMGAALTCGLAAGALARTVLKQARVGWLDRLLGAVFGLARGLALCSIVYLALTAFPVRIAAVAEARSAPALAVGARLLSLCTSAEVRAKFMNEYERLFARLRHDRAPSGG
jgi:membrane protein required for colicin V production